MLILGIPTVPYIETVSDAAAGPFTVFAPTNDAFVDVLGELNLSALTDLTTDQSGYSFTISHSWC